MSLERLRIHAIHRLRDTVPNPDLERIALYGDHLGIRVLAQRDRLVVALARIEAPDIPCVRYSGPDETASLGDPERARRDSAQGVELPGAWLTVRTWLDPVWVEV